MSAKQRFSPSKHSNLAQHRTAGLKESTAKDTKDAPIQTIAVIAGRKYIVVSRPNSSCLEENSFNLIQNEFQSM